MELNESDEIGEMGVPVELGDICEFLSSETVDDEYDDEVSSTTFCNRLLLSALWLSHSTSKHRYAKRLVVSLISTTDLSACSLILSNNPMISSRL